MLINNFFLIIKLTGDKLVYRALNQENEHKKSVKTSQSKISKNSGSKLLHSTKNDDQQLGKKANKLKTVVNEVANKEEQEHADEDKGKRVETTQYVVSDMSVTKFV